MEQGPVMCHQAPPRQQHCLFFRLVLVGPFLRIPRRAFSVTPSPLNRTATSLEQSITPAILQGVSSSLAEMDRDTPGGVSTGALESRPQASIFGEAVAPPPPPAYLGVLGCPGAPGTWRGQREHS